MSFRSNLNAASTPSFHNVNHSANPQAPQSTRLPYPYYSYPTSTGIPASAHPEYQQSDLVRVHLYTHHPNDDQLHSFSSSSSIPITGYPQSGVSATNTGAMQLGPSDMSPSVIPTTVPHMPYIQQNYPLANAAPQVIMSTEVDAQSGVNTTARDINIDMNAGDATSNSSLPNFLPKGDAVLMEHSQRASQQANNNDFRFSTIPNTDSGVSNTFPESSQRTLLENSLQSMTDFSVGRQEVSSLDTSMPDSVPQMYTNPTMSSFHGQANFVTPSNNMQYLPTRQYATMEFSNANNSVGYGSMNIADRSSYTWSADTNHTPQDPNGQEFLGAEQGMAQPNAALQFHPSTPHYPAANSNSQSFTSSTSISSHSNPVSYSEPLYGQINTANTINTFNEPTISASNTNTFSTNSNSADNYRLYNGSYSDSAANEQSLQAANSSPNMEWSSHGVPYNLRNSYPTHSNPGIDRLSTDISSQSLSRDLRPASFIRRYSEMTVPRTHTSNLGVRTNIRSYSSSMANYSESVQEQPQFVRHGHSYTNIMSTPLRTPTSLRNDTLSSSSLNEQPLLTPPFLVGSSPLPQTIPQAVTTTSTYGTLALQGSDSPTNVIREESLTPTPNNTSTRAQQPLFKMRHDRRRREISSFSNEDFGQERLTNQETFYRGQMSSMTSQEIQGSPRTSSYPRLPSFSNFPPLSAPLPDTFPQSSTSQSVVLSRAHRSDISRRHAQSPPNVRFQRQRKRQRDLVSASDNVSEDEEYVAGTSGSEVNFNNGQGNNDLETRIRQRDWQSFSNSYVYANSQSMELSGSMATTAAQNSEYSTLATAIEVSPIQVPSSSTDSSQSAPPTYQESDEQNVSLLSSEQNPTESMDQSEQANEDPTNLNEALEQVPAKKVKMHQCSICKKFFPRPSGLATHMNSHSGARPYKCPLPYCAKSFAVRSNARRHMRTHGVGSGGSASSGGTSTGRRRRQRRRQSDVSESESEASDGEIEATVQEIKPRVFEFEPPVVINTDVGWPLNLCLKDEDEEDGSELEEEEGDTTGSLPSGSSRSPVKKSSKMTLAKRKGKGKMAPKLRWVPQSLQSRTNASRLRSISPGSDMWDVDADAEGSSEDDHDERRSYQTSPSSTSYDASHYAAIPPSHNHMKIATASASTSSSLSGGNIFSRPPISSSPLAGKSVRRPPIAPAPLPPVTPSSSRASADLNAKFEERNSYAEAGTYPYHPSQWRTLPGPALVPSLRG